MANVSVLTPKDDGLLIDFLKSLPDASIYHTPMWRQVLTQTYGYKDYYLASWEDGNLVALMPLMLVESWLTGKRLVSLPFSNFCGPVGDQTKFSALIDEAIRLSTNLRVRALEIRTQADVNDLADNRFRRVSYFLTSIVQLDSDPDRVWKRFKDRNVRTEVRQAIKKGVEVDEASDTKELEEFYRLFTLTRLKHGVPPQPFKFFRNLWKYLYPDYLRLFIARHSGQIVGGLITLSFGSTMCAAYIGSDENFRSYRVHQLLFWRAMETGCKEGRARFDFLRTPKQSKSLRYFKPVSYTHLTLPTKA